MPVNTSQCGETDFTTPSTIEERNDKNYNKEKEDNAMYRMQDIFNSDVDLDDSMNDGAEQSFSEISSRINKHNPRGRAQTQILHSKKNSKR